MSLFQKAVLNKYLKSADQNILKEKYSIFSTHFLNLTIQENIRNSKEEQYQEGFLYDLFVNILGYTKNPTPNFNLTTELKNIKDSKKVDGAILLNSNTKAVIELKGMNTTDLSSIETQAFGYKNNHPECTYIITSNFQKIRFYIDNAIEHLEFDLFNLSFEDFQVLYLCLAFENIEKDVPKRIKDESLTIEDKITKDLYKDYSAFKRALFDNLVQFNTEVDPLTLFKKAQKLLDRFLFLFFAEDRGLLQPNSVRTIINRWEKRKEIDAYQPLMDSYRQYFGYLNTGHHSNDLIVFAYNGGLFAPDDILDHIKIDDELLRIHTLKIAKYDFASEVDVNILGHIFENSLNEIDEIQAELRGDVVEKTKTKRKKDGVFYTPKYITKYIVENTVGKLCDKKKAELELIESDYYSEVTVKKLTKKKKEEKKHLLDKLESYRNWLLQLTICDPACGSGAFLNQALDFLIAEHRYIDELQANLFGDALILTDIEGSILENNLYGVDINEESIEIAKLSLWLRTAEPNRKLTTLSNNLKCGNSLINDPSVAGEKAFNWEQEFPHVFGKGGFDVIIGNPPYVRQELFKEIKPYLEKNYKCFNSIADLYTYFIELGINIMKDDGKFSFILPNKFIKATYGQEIRNVITSQASLDLLLDFDDYPVFADATTYPLIFVISKNLNYTNLSYSVINKNLGVNDPFFELDKRKCLVKFDNLIGDNWNLNSEITDSIFRKIEYNSISLSDLVDNNIFRGVSTGRNDVFILNHEAYKSICTEKNKNNFQKIVTGKEVKRYNLKFENQYLLFLPWEYDLEVDENIKNYLLLNRDSLNKRPEVKDNRYNWWCLSRYGSNNSKYLFESKIIYPRINNQCNFYFDNEGEYSLSDNNFFIATNKKFLIPILNSTLIFYYIKSKAPSLQGGYYDFRRSYIESLPLKIPKDIVLYNEYSDIMHTLNKELQNTATKFIKLLASELELTEPSKKLQEWYDLEFADFVKEVKKKKIELSLAQKSEWMDFFESEKEKVNQIQAEIQAADKQIDQMVYELYELTPEEIEIIEQS